MIDDITSFDEDESSPVLEQKIEAVPEDVESLKKALAEEVEKAENNFAQWQRAQADFINYKRRSEHEKGEAIKYANGLLILSLLSIVDDLQRAIASVPEEISDHNWVEGINLINRKLTAFLESQGVTEISALGEKFDPNFHDAVMYEIGDEGMVISELQKGYMLHDRVIRPTMVVVGKGTENEDICDNENG